MEENLKTLKKEVSELSKRKEFRHHVWFLEYHLNIVEKMSLELLEKYPNARRDYVLALVWIHDYAKIMGVEDLPSVLESSREYMLGIGFEESFVEEVVELLRVFESKMELDLSEASIEVQIVSSADGAAHMHGPFYQVYWHENCDRSVSELMESNMRKLEKDWSRKIVLPEVKELLKDRYSFLMDSFGKLPERFFN